MNQLNLPHLPPYPRVGEILRALAQAFDTKAKNRDVDRLARGDDIDWALAQKLLVDLFQEPLSKNGDQTFAAFITNYIAGLHEKYAHLVITMSLDSMSRDEALPLLVEHWFALQGAGFPYFVKQDFGGPDLVAFLDSERNPFCTVFAWLNADGGAGLAKAAYPNTTGADKVGREMVARWEKGLYLPDSSSIRLFLAALDRNGSAEQKEKIGHLRRWLLIARAMCWFERKMPQMPLRALMLRIVLSGFPARDIGLILSQAVQEAAKPLQPLKLPGLMLTEKLKRTSHKVAGDQLKTLHELAEFEHLLKTSDLDGRAGYLLPWLQGRWQILSGAYAKALPHYKEAVALANYRAGENMKQIIHEALVLAGQLKDKAFLKQLKQHAIAFGLFAKPLDAAVVQDWEVDQFRQGFVYVFPPEGRFVEAKTSADLRLELPSLIFNMTEIDSRQPDLRHPDRVIGIKSADGQVRRWPQLRLFASFGRTAAVRALLAHGASVDQLDQSGGSALLCAIQYAACGERDAMDLLLAVPHAKATLDRVTGKKRISPLFCAIEYGDPDVVERILKMGAGADQRGQVDAQTPLYFCMRELSKTMHPEKAHQVLMNSLLQDRDGFQSEVRRRSGAALGDIFGSRALMDKLLVEPENQKIAEAVVRERLKIDAKRHSIPKLLRIVELLLEYGANPNAHHDYPVPGRTPLMLAAEDNAVPAFDASIIL